MNSFALLAGAIAFLATLVGGFLALHYRKQIGLLAAFTAGVLVEVSLLEIMPEAFRIANSAGISSMIIVLMASAGFLTLFLIGKSNSDRAHPASSSSNGARNRGHLAVSEFIFHSFLEGVVIALGFEVNLAVGAVVAIAVIGHDSSDGLSVMTVAMNRGYSMRSSKMILAFDALAPTLGVLAATLVSIPSGAIAVILPFIAGGFIYIGAL
ncbi:MAG: ZIP family metal transporter, partial [Methanomassiliicoccales archaeon]|nr:ZIP family metal transporter [Methanomassiliicoccales archaeon]